MICAQEIERMSASLAAAKTDRLSDLQGEEQRLSKLIEERTKRVMALTEEAERLRQEVATAFRTKFAARFKDLDIVQALAGYPASHTMTVFGVGYVLRPPVQNLVYDVERFATNPVVDGATGKINLGPMRGEELTLLAWLTAVQADNGQKRDLTTVGLGERLTAIRKLPEVLILRLAEECVNIQTYLNVCLEQELGNS